MSPFVILNKNVNSLLYRQRCLFGYLVFVSFTKIGKREKKGDLNLFKKVVDDLNGFIYIIYDLNEFVYENDR